MGLLKKLQNSNLHTNFNYLIVYPTEKYYSRRRTILFKSSLRCTLISVQYNIITVL